MKYESDKEAMLEGQVDTLKRKLLEAEAQQVHQYHFASVGLKNAGDLNQGGAVILTLTALGGKEIIKPVAIKNGLGEKTIEGLHEDLVRSFNDAVEFKPKGA